MLGVAHTLLLGGLNKRRGLCLCLLNGHHGAGQSGLDVGTGRADRATGAAVHSNVLHRRGVAGLHGCCGNEIPKRFQDRTMTQNIKIN